MLEAAPKDLGACRVKTQRQTIAWRARSDRMSHGMRRIGFSDLGPRQVGSEHDRHCRSARPGTQG